VKFAYLLKPAVPKTTQDLSHSLPKTLLNTMQTTLQTTFALNSRQGETLRAAVNRIIPADDAPSGWGAGVGGFLTLLWEREPQFLPLYQQGLDALDAKAHRTENAAFATLAPVQQDAVLTGFEANDTTGFFRLLVQQTMEGYYADPGNGGNKNGAAWDMIGFRVTA
jgi:hypothetical protein